MTELFRILAGNSPLLINIPHAGTVVPESLQRRLSPAAAALPDTDWFVDGLYAFATKLGASMLVATHARYVVDLNRPPDDTPLYTGHTTGLLPKCCFDGQPVYQPGQEPGSAEPGQRRDTYWRPYHDRLSDELDRIRSQHGHAILLDAHSIRSELPLLFEGTLPHLNLGSFDGVSADPGLIALAESILGADDRWAFVRDGRFKGGFITRHYGKPASGVHALQLEIAQRAYMQETPPESSEASMAPLQARLAQLVESLNDWRPQT